MLGVKTDYKVRFIGLWDLASVVRIAWSSNQAMCNDSQFRDYLSSPPRHGYVCESGGKVLGYVLFSVVGKSFRLDTIVVDPEQRRQGVGTALIAHVSHLMQDNGIKFVDAELVDKQQDVLAFFSSVGFEQIGHKKRWSALDWMSPAAKLLTRRRA